MIRLLHDAHQAHPDFHLPPHKPTKIFQLLPFWSLYQTQSWWQTFISDWNVLSLMHRHTGKHTLILLSLQMLWLHWGCGIYWHTHRFQYQWSKNTFCTASRQKSCCQPFLWLLCWQLDTTLSHVHIAFGTLMCQFFERG